MSQIVYLHLGVALSPNVPVEEERLHAAVARLQLLRVQELAEVVHGDEELVRDAGGVEQHEEAGERRHAVHAVEQRPVGRGGEEDLRDDADDARDAGRGDDMSELHLRSQLGLVVTAILCTHGRDDEREKHVHTAQRQDGVVHVLAVRGHGVGDGGVHVVGGEVEEERLVHGVARVPSSHYSFQCLRKHGIGGHALLHTAAVIQRHVTQEALGVTLCNHPHHKALAAHGDMTAHHHVALGHDHLLGEALLAVDGQHRHAATGRPGLRQNDSLPAALADGIQHLSVRRRQWSHVHRVLLPLRHDAELEGRSDRYELDAAAPGGSVVGRLDAQQHAPTTAGRDGAERHHGEGERDGVPASEQQSETRRGGGEGLKRRDGQRFRLLLEEERFGGVKRRRNQLSDGLGMQGAERYDIKVDVQKERVLDHETTRLVEGEEEPLCVRLIARKLTHVQDEISDSSCERRTTSALSQKRALDVHILAVDGSLAEIQHHKLLDDTTTSALGIHGGSTRGSR